MVIFGALWGVPLFCPSCVVFPVEIWGTFGDWAAAVIPCVAVFSAVDIWMQERKLVVQESLARLDVPWGKEGVCYIHNRLDHPVTIVEMNGCYCGAFLRPDEAFQVPQPPPRELLVKDWFGADWVLCDRSMPCLASKRKKRRS